MGSESLGAEYIHKSCPTLFEILQLLIMDALFETYIPIRAMSHCDYYRLLIDITPVFK